MRIVIITRYFWPDLGGVQVQLRELAKQWAATGHAVTVLTCRWNLDWPADESIDGYRVIRWPVTTTRFVGTIRFLFQIRQWLVRHRSGYDVVMVSMLKHAAWQSARVARRHPFPLFLKAAGAGDSGDMGWQERGNLGRMIRQGTKNVDGVFAPSEAVADELRQAGYPRVILLPNGVPIPERAWQKEETSHYRKKMGWPDRPTLVTTGRLSPEKGLVDLVSLMPAILARNPDLQLAIVGEGPQRDELERCRQKHSLGDRVLLTGVMSDVEPALRASDLYLLPSRFEGLSVALLEALGLGMPAVASDIPANRGILPPENLPLFPLGDADRMTTVIAAGLQRGESTDLARQRASVQERFGIAAVAGQHIKLFGQALSGDESG